MSPLTLSTTDMRTLGYKIVDMLVDYYDTVGSQSVANGSQRSELESLLREPPPQAPTPVDEVLDRLQSDVLSNMAHLTHPRFFAYVPSPGNFVSVMADALTSGFNAFVGSWRVASGPAEIELVTVDWLRQLCGLSDGAGGLFVSGGSMANLTAIAVARKRILDDHITNAVAYCSEQTHSSIDRAFHILGFAPEQLQRLPVDDRLRLDVDALQKKVEADRAAGLRPFCVIANAGTTNTGAIDPLPEIADFCNANNLWFHIDGAYGAPAVLCESGRQALVGIDRADSLTLDPHKWLFQPYEIGCVLVRDEQWLHETFTVSAEYLRDVSGFNQEVNFRDRGPQLTRSFRALKLWMSLKTFGLDAFKDAVEHGIKLAETAEQLLRESGQWEVVTPAQLAIVSFRYSLPGILPVQCDAITNRLPGELAHAGMALLSSTELYGRPALRLCTINPRTTVEDLRLTIEGMEEIAGERS